VNRSDQLFLSGLISRLPMKWAQIFTDTPGHTLIRARLADPISTRMLWSRKITCLHPFPERAHHAFNPLCRLRSNPVNRAKRIHGAQHPSALRRRIDGRRQTKGTSC
jgi:hypothetical protein